MSSPRGGRARRDPAQEAPSSLRHWYDQTKDTLVRALLMTAVVISLVAQFVPVVGDFLSDNIRFGAAALLFAVSFFFLDAITNATAAKPAEDDSIIIRQTKDIHPYIKNAFRARSVSIDFSGFTGETLSNLLSDFLDDIEAGRVQPKRLVIRILVPDPRKPMALPCNVEDGSDNPTYRGYILRNTHDHAERIVRRMHDLRKLYPDREYEAEVRMHRLTPLFKLFVINESTAFWGFYPIEVRSLRNSEGPGEVYDLRGVKTRMFGVRSEQGREVDRHQVYVVNDWFASIWSSGVIATRYIIN